MSLPECDATLRFYFLTSCWSGHLESYLRRIRDDQGSYKALELGKTIESAVDLTGGIPEMIDISNLQMRPEKLFDLMRKADSNDAFMSCSLSVSFHLLDV